jgi:membrane protein DedA with SNARE-associated domain
MSGLEQWLAGVPSQVVYLVAFGFVFAESALFAGFFIPGESALLAAGVLAGLGHVSVVAVAVRGVAGEPEYRWMESQIAYSRIYMAGHVSSDITGGALLGDMIGEYFWVTRHP